MSLGLNTIIPGPIPLAVSKVENVEPVIKCFNFLSLSPLKPIFLFLTKRIGTDGT
jgi:hypothetical protein